MNMFAKSCMAMALTAVIALPAVAQESVSVADWEFGPRYDVEGDVEIWNPVKQKLLAGEHIIGGTVRSSDPRVYCAMAESGAWDFIWTEMQHEQLGWESVSYMWARCPHAHAVPGARIPYADERELQQAWDAGAMVIVVPTVDTAEEAEEAVKYTKFPPLGYHSSGGGQGPGFWSDVPGGYRATFNDNVVLILMIETIEGVENVHEIAAVPGIDALFVAQGDLGNFSGYEAGDPEFELLISEIETAARNNGLAVCGPLGWRNNPDREGYTCFQGPNDLSLLGNASRTARENSEP